MFKLFENIKLALQSILSKKVRSFLTMLGVIIGVFAIVLLIGIGQGVKQQVTDQIEGLGSNLLFITPGGGGRDNGGFGSISFTNQDVSVVESVPGIKYVVPVSMVPLPISTTKPLLPSEMTPEQLQAQLEQSNGSGSAGVFSQSQLMVMATTVNAEHAFTGDVFSGAEFGRMFTQEEYDQVDKVAVVLAGALKQLFPNTSGEQVIGKTLYIGKEEFSIVGTVQSESQSQGNSLFGGQNQQFSNIVIIPLTTGQSILGTEDVNQIAVTVADTEQVSKVKDDVRIALLEAHGGVEDFSILTQEDILSIFDQVLGVLTTMLGGIAAISLLVGGIGVMNIMLVSVTERTREVGLRKAVGASAFDILTQFLVEAVLLTFLGGAIGVGLALVGKTVMDIKFGFAPVIDLNSVMMAFAFTVVVGIFFGVTPAIRAARLNPIDALKYE